MVSNVPCCNCGKYPMDLYCIDCLNPEQDLKPQLENLNIKYVLEEKRNMDLQSRVEELESDNKWLLQQISMCRARMSDRDIESVCSQWAEMKEQARAEGGAE